MTTIILTKKQTKLLDALHKLGMDASFPFKFSNNVIYSPDCPNKKT